MNTDFDQLVASTPLAALLERHPVAREFFRNLNLPGLDSALSLPAALMSVSADWLDEFGLTRWEIERQLALFLQAMTATESARAIGSLTILGGRDKAGQPENATLQVEPGTVVSIVGPTGSGKSRLLADIECLAQGDTPTRRRVLIDGQPVSDEERFGLEGRIVAQLSQNMNFVMDLTVAEFLEMHARSRAAGGDEAGAEADIERVTRRCFERANALAGEKFTPATKVTLLSGGQSRALMIADCAYMSQSPIVLIDEIENAGVNRRAAIELLARREKIVLISTHDPLLALEADKRIVIRGGGISRVLETSDEERRSLEELRRMDNILADARDRLRSGQRVTI